MANKEINPDTWESYEQANSEDVETIPNKQRGCGYLKAGNSYIRMDPSAFSSDGVLPAMVVFTDTNGDLHPIPFKESLPRGYRTINGTNFLAAAERERQVRCLYPGPTPHQETHQEVIEDMADIVPGYETPADVPASELSRHLDRMALDGFEGSEHWGSITPANSKDLLMRVGKSYYDEPWDFIDEALELGLNKGISVHSNKSPPTIQPGRTRCWLIHPHACGEDMPGVIGFSYLTRCIFTIDKDGNVPKYAQDYADSGKLDVVDIGEPEPREDDEEREGEDVAESHQTPDSFDESEPEAQRQIGSDVVQGRISEKPETVDLPGNAEIEEVETRGEQIPPQRIPELQKADLSELAAENWIPVNEPPLEYDAVAGDGGVLAIVDGRKVTASNNWAWDQEAQHGSQRSGPYTIEVRQKNGDRMLLVEK